MSQETSEYVELSSQAYSLFAENVATANGRVLEYWKSVWQIASRPYASTEVETGLRENLDRANQIFGLTVNGTLDVGPRVGRVRREAGGALDEAPEALRRSGPAVS